MSKVKVFTPTVYYVAFFVLNLFNSYVLTHGFLSPNISPFDSFGSSFLSLLGDFGLLLLLFCAFCLIFKKNRGRCNAVMITTIILTLVILFLAIFSNMFSMFFSFSQLSSFENPAQMSLILEYVSYFLGMFLQPNVLVHFIPLLLFIALRFFINTDYDKTIARTSHKLAFMGHGVLFMLLPLILMVVNVKGTIQSASMSGLYGASNSGVYNYYLYSASEAVFKGDNTKASDKEINALNKFLEGYLWDNSHINSYTNEAANKNLVIIQLEAVNDFVINLWVDGIEITPNINKLVADSYYNTRFYSTAGIGNTSDCEFSSITGLYPNGNDLGVFTYAGKNYPTVTSDFSKKDYQTFSIHGNDGNFYNRNVQHVEMLHFDEHIDKFDIVDRYKQRNEKAEIFGDWISDYCLLDESIKIFDKKSKSGNFFAYDILVTSHTPFIDNSKIKSLPLKSTSRLAKACLEYYHYVDSAIGNFFDKLKTNYQSLYRDTVFVLYGDHTSSIMRSDLESVTKKEYDDVQYRLEMQNVPFIMHCPDIFNPQVDNNVRGQVDIYPTISNLFGLESKYKIGADILSDDVSLIYSPRSLDLIYNDYVIMVPSKSIYYTNHASSAKISHKEKISLVKQFNNYKYYNDLILKKNYFK